MKDVKEKIEAGVLICPMPPEWADFSIFLKSKLPEGVEIPNPLILGGWPASDFNKNMTLKQQLIIADNNGILDEAVIFLSKIPEESWIFNTNRSGRLNG